MSEGRNLVVLADGTGNSAAKSFKTNVWRLYQALDLTDGSQLAVFGDGVGTSSIKPIQILGLALGVGVKRNVLNLYKFLCRNYNEGDRLWAFGFSRGAFTVRVLAGLIHHEGLVSFRSEEELSRNAIAAYRAYRTKAFATMLPWVRWGRVLRDLVIYYWNRMVGARTYQEIKEETFRRRRHIIGVHFIGVWDTVAAYGLPIDELTQAVDKWVWPMSFRDTSLLSNVDNARHALSLDDERRTFFPIPWNETDERKLRDEDPTIAPDRLLQVWFAGVHANVGGGYPDDALSHVPLCWMIEEAAKKGLRFEPGAVKSYAALSSPTGRIYDSRSGFGMFYRYQPRDAQMLMGAGNRPLVHYGVIARMARGNDGYAPISVPHDVDVLAPYGAPVKFDPSAAANRKSQLQSPSHDLAVLAGRDPDQQAKEMQALFSNIERLNETVGPDDRAPLVALVQDTVWWRRLLYFVSLGFALTAVAYPVLYDYLRLGGVTETVNLTTGGIVDWAAGLIKGFLPSFAAPWLAAVVKNPAAAAFVLTALGVSLGLSTFLQKRICDRVRAAWQVEAQADGMLLDRLKLTDQRAAAARAAVIFGLLFLAGMILGGNLLQPGFGVIVHWSFGLLAVASAGLFLWRVKHDAGTIDADRPGLLLSLARKLRTSPLAVQCYRWLSRKFAPAVFLAATVLVVASFTYRGVFDTMNAVGHYCRGTEQLAMTEKVGKSAKDFPTNSMCHATGLVLIQGGQYRIRLTMKEEWFDKGVRTDVAGFPTKEFLHYTATPMKRWWTKNWFLPVARIGRFGNYEYALEPSAPLPVIDYANQCPGKSSALSGLDAIRDTPNPISQEEKERRLKCETVEKKLHPSRTLISDIRAGASGELFIYVNDAVLLWPGYEKVFYDNNIGTATVEVERIRADAIISED